METIKTILYWLAAILVAGLALGGLFIVVTFGAAIMAGAVALTIIFLIVWGCYAVLRSRWDG